MCVCDESLRVARSGKEESVKLLRYKQQNSSSNINALLTELEDQFKGRISEIRAL